MPSRAAVGRCLEQLTSGSQYSPQFGAVFGSLESGTTVKPLVCLPEQNQRSQILLLRSFLGRHRLFPLNQLSWGRREDTRFHLTAFSIL